MTRARDLSNLMGSGNFSSTTFTATAGQTAFTIAHTQGFVQVFMNGLLLDLTADYTSNGTAITLTSAAAAGDEIEVVKYNTFSVGDAVPASGGTFTGNVAIPGHVVQTVEHRFDSDHRQATSSTSYVASQITGAITPRASSSKVLVQAFTSGNNNNSSNHGLRTTIYRGSTNLFSQDHYVMVESQSSANRIHVPLSMAVLDSPSSTSAVTYSVYFKSTNTSSSVEIPAHTNTASVLLLQEIAQ